MDVMEYRRWEGDGDIAERVYDKREFTGLSTHHSAV
jgi:hypothetical protein